MTKNTRQRFGFFATITVILLFGVWALSPLWLNSCISSRLSEREIEILRTHKSWEDLSLEQQSNLMKYYKDLEITCGVQDMSLQDKLDIARFEGRILDELEYISLIVLRVEFVGAIENTDLYHYQGYTFFYIQAFDAVGGGSGYMEITPFPFLHEADDER